MDSPHAPPWGALWFHEAIFDTLHKDNLASTMLCMQFIKAKVRQFFGLIPKQLHKPIVYSGILTLGIFIGLLFPIIETNDYDSVRAPSEEFPYISPLLECQNSSVENARTLDHLQDAINDQINEGINLGTITTASIYYRDLNNGPWFGINEYSDFSPASLVKVPVMITLYKQEELQPEFLKKVIQIKSPVTYDDQNFIPKHKLVQGQSYSIEELITRMIVDSDNYAYDVLLNEVDQDLLKDVYSDLGMNVDDILAASNGADILNVKEYASFFRILFNSSYLSDIHSNQALEIMTRSTFENGLAAGTPEDIKVAHKFGERLFTFSGIRQLHDCGIVYYPQKPYILCVMTKGSDFNDLSNFIKTVSDMTYQSISQEEND